MANGTPANASSPPTQTWIMIGGFVGIAVLIVMLFSWIHSDIAQLETRFDNRLARIDARFARLEDRMGGLEQRMARQEGLLSGIFPLAELPPALADPETGPNPAE